MCIVHCARYRAYTPGGFDTLAAAARLPVLAACGAVSDGRRPKQVWNGALFSLEHAWLGLRPPLRLQDIQVHYLQVHELADEEEDKGACSTTSAERGNGCSETRESPCILRSNGSWRADILRARLWALLVIFVEHTPSCVLIHYRSYWPVSFARPSITFWQRCAPPYGATHSDSVVCCYMGLRHARRSPPPGRPAPRPQLSKAAPHAISPHQRNAVASGKCRNSIRVAL